MTDVTKTTSPKTASTESTTQESRIKQTYMTNEKGNYFCVLSLNQPTSEVPSCNCGSTYAKQFTSTKYISKFGPVYYGTMHLHETDTFKQMLRTKKITQQQADIIKAMSPNEGKVDSVQAYDGEVLTVGAMQKTIKTPNGLGELSTQLADFKKLYPDAYKRVV
jgi:hypothetical protein